MDIWREPDDNDRRWYHDGKVSALSVTQILSMALDEDTSGLEYWKRQNNGYGDAPHHEHIYWFSAPRGTLCHVEALDTLTDGTLWGPEETRSLQQLVDGPDDGAFDDGASTDMDDIVYSILCNQDVVVSRDQYDTVLQGETDLIDVATANIETFTDYFDEVCDVMGVTADDAIAVERLLLYNDGDIRYGGQCDLLYTDPDGHVVLADLKTSSGLRHKHRLQLVAYKHAVENADDLPNAVDRVEVWRIDPDEPEWVVHTNDVPDRLSDDDRVTDDYWFDDQWGNFSYDDMDDYWETFRQLAIDAHAQV